MAFHPRDPAYRRPLTRRDFLRRSLAAGVALPSTAAILAACGEGDGTTPPADGNAPEVRFGTPEKPVELQLFDDNPAIASDLPQEEGPLVIYNWEEYMYPKVVKEFGKEFGVEVRIEEFYNLEEAVPKIQTGEVTFDVFVPTMDYLAKLVAAKLVQPLNHDYLPNLSNIWPSLQDPFYDRGSRYSVPYAIYHTGIGWRTDLLPLEVEDLRAMSNPYDVFWDHGVPGKTGIYDVSRDAILLGMYHVEGSSADPNTTDAAKIDAGKDALIQLNNDVGVVVEIEIAYVSLPEGQMALTQSWSGDLINAGWGTANPKKENGLLRYYWPARDGFGGVIDNDQLAILKGAKNPVLAHHFINFMMDNDHSMKNFSWNGYQAPLSALDPADLIKNGWPGLEGWFSWENGGRWENIVEAIVTDQDVEIGTRFAGLPLEDDTLWTDAFAEFASGAT
jgi:spermidine/putrescine transport system substrate-binding protein